VVSAFRYCAVFKVVVMWSVTQLREVYTSVNRIVDKFGILRNDQLEMQFLYLSNPHLMSLDLEERVFATGYLRTFKNDVDHWLGHNLSYSIYNSPPKKPFISAVHFNGGDKTPYYRYTLII
jgi:hypothetical protein